MIAVVHHSDIAEDVRRHFAFIRKNRTVIKRETESKLSNVVFQPFQLRERVPETIAIDGSHVPLYRTASMWLIAVRAVALRYRFSDDDGDLAYELQDYEINEGAELVTTSKRVAEDLSSFARELRELTAPRKGEAPRRMADYARILREFQLASSVAKNRNQSVILMDGTLSTPPPKLIEKLADEAVQHCNENGNILVGVSKDSNTNLFGSQATDEELLRTVDRRELLYVKTPATERTMPGPRRDIFFVKFHPDAPKWFRVDVASSNYDPGELFGSMGQFSRNQLCPGYPLPLAEAHACAVMLRKYPKLYDDLLFRIGQEMGFTMEEIAWGRTNVEGRRMDAFHAYLDVLSKRGPGA